VENSASRIPLHTQMNMSASLARHLTFCSPMHRPIKKPKASTDTLGSGLRDLWPRGTSTYTAIKPGGYLHLPIQLSHDNPTRHHLIRILNII
jgi:hypothetical protein